MKKNLLFGAAGLLIGLTVGFFYANHLNRSQLDSANGPAQPTLAQESQNIASGANVPNVLVKEQPNRGGMMPDITRTLETADNEPENFNAQISAGELYFKIKDFAKAGQFYDRAYALTPKNYDQLVSLGNRYFDIGRFERAGELYQLALSQNPKDVGVRTDLGVTFVERSKPDLDRAILEFQKALETDPAHEPTLYNLGIAYYKKGQTEESRKMLKRLKTGNPESELTVRLESVIKN